MTRSRIPLTFGVGLDRVTGASAVRPESQADLRNATLLDGRIDLRPGLPRLLFLAGYTDIVAVVPVRKYGVSVLVAYNGATGTVAIWLADSAGTGASFVADVWFLAPGSPTPRVSAVDAYETILIAHDADYASRQKTVRYTPKDGTWGYLGLDLVNGDPGAGKFVYFRGVARHLNYVLAWGFGTAADPDRPETLRMSMAGEPTNFRPEHYFLVGIQGDPIIGGGTVGDAFGVMKDAQSFKLVGYDRQTFGMRPLDPSYGQVSARLGCTGPDGEYFFWSATGPRSTTGGPSVDLGLPLDLDGPAPDALATATPITDAFAFYDETAREVVFVFGRWAYVLHLRNGDRRWSFRQYGVALGGAGVLYTGGAVSFTARGRAKLALPLVYHEPAHVTGDADPAIDVTWTVEDGPVTPSTRCQVWWRSLGQHEDWHLYPVDAYAGDGFLTIFVKDFLTEHEIAVRFVDNGVPGAGYTVPDPSQWPADARTRFITGGDVTAWSFGLWARFSNEEQSYAMRWQGPGTGQTPGPSTIGSQVADKRIRFEREWSYDGVTWTLMRGEFDPGVTNFPNEVSLKPVYVRVRPIGPHAVGAWYAIGVAQVIAPEPPVGVVNVRTVPDFGGDRHVVQWEQPIAVDGVDPQDGPYQVLCRHQFDGTPPLYLDGEIREDGEIVNVDQGVHSTEVFVSDMGFAHPRTVHIRVRVKRDTGDVSEWAVGGEAEP